MSFVASDWMPKYLVANHWDALSGFVATKVMPGFAASGGVMEGIAALGGSLSNPVGAMGGDGRREDEVADDARAMEAFGMTRARRNEVARLGLKLMFTEETSGANDEALLCAQKGPAAEVSWGVCNDYRTFVPALAKMWEERLGGVAKLRVQAVFAEEDAMIGGGGGSFLRIAGKAVRVGMGLNSRVAWRGVQRMIVLGIRRRGFWRGC